MSLTEYLEGAAFFVLILGGAGVAAWAALRWMPSLRGTPRALAFATLWLFAILAVHILPGAFGLLGRVEVAVASLGLAAAALLAARVRPPPAAPAEGPATFPGAPESGIRSWVFAIFTSVATTALLFVLMMEDAEGAPWHVDVVSFHLPNVARWIQDGSLWRIDDFIPDRAPGNYPETGDVFSLAVVLPWRNDFLVRFVNYPMLLMAGLGCYALARELRVPAATATLVGAAFIALPVVSWSAYAGFSDTSMLATFAAGSYFLVRHVRTGARADLVLAGLGLGISLGTRWYSVYAVAAVLGVWAVAWLLAKRPLREVLPSVAALSGLALLAGGFWLLRNWALSGNPVFPVAVAPFGLEIFDAPHDPYRETIGFTIADYVTDWGVWRDYLWPGFLAAMSWGSIVYWAGLAAGGGLALWRLARGGTERRDAALVLALAVAAAVIGVCFSITPYSAVGLPGEPVFGFVNSRYVVPGLVLAAGVLGWALTQAGPWRQALELVVALGALDGLRRSAGLPGPDFEALPLLGLALLGAAGVAAWIAVRRLRAEGRRTALALGAAALLLVAVGVGRIQERTFNDVRYIGVDETFDYVRERAPEGARVGLVGEGWGNYPFFGPEFRNEVEFVGPRVEGTLRPYRDRSAFFRALRRGGYDLVVVQYLYDLDRSLPGRQERWLRDGGYRRVATGRQIYAFNAPLRVYVPPGSRL